MGISVSGHLETWWWVGVCELDWLDTLEFGICFQTKSTLTLFISTKSRKVRNNGLRVTFSVVVSSRKHISSKSFRTFGFPERMVASR